MTHETVRSGTKIRSRLARAAGFAPVAVLALAMGVGHDAGVPSAAKAAAPGLPAAPANGEMGFVVTQFHESFYRGDDKVDCPEGKGADFLLRAAYLRTLAPADQARLKLKENEPELEKAWKVYGRNAKGGNICTNIYEFMDRPPTPMMKGAVARGLNLDNDDGGAGNDSYTCKHQNFTSPTGEKGIDHQLWRVEGCNEQYRGPDDSGNTEHRKGADDMMMTGQRTQVILLRGVNSLVNDKDVEVIYANTDDRPIVEPSGRPIAKASYSVADGTKLQYRNVLHGHIVNGVLTTDTKDIHLNQAGNGNRGQFDMAHARVRLEFQPDGTMTGLLGGYQPILSVLNASRGGGTGTVDTAGANCAGIYASLRANADGDKDPKTGQCRRISYSYDILAVPGFVNDVDRKIASK